MHHLTAEARNATLKEDVTSGQLAESVNVTDTATASPVAGGTALGRDAFPVVAQTGRTLITDLSLAIITVDASSFANSTGTAKGLFNLVLRQAMGTAQSLRKLAGLDWEVPNLSPHRTVPYGG